MKEVINLCLCFIFAFIVRNILSKSIPTTNYQIQNELSASNEILTFLNENIKSLQWANSKELILILGETGSDKILLSMFLINEKLTIIDNQTFTGSFGLIEKHSTIIAPQLITDTESFLDHYVLPDLSSTIGVKYDISISYYIHRLLKFAEKLKYVFTIDYLVVKDGLNLTVDKKNKIKEFISNAIKLMGNVNVLRNSIALVIMNVDLNVDRKEVMDNVYYVFESTKSENNLKSEQIVFIDILMQKTGGEFDRMALFRRPTKTGPVRNIPSMQKNKDEISSIIYNSIKYSSTNDIDFGNILPKRSRYILSALINEVRERLIAALLDFGDQVERYFNIQRSKSNDLGILYRKSNEIFQKFAQINTVDLMLFSKQLIDLVNSLDFDISLSNLNIILEYIKLGEFLASVSSSSKSFSIPNVLMKTTQYFNKTQTVYASALEFQRILSNHEVQRDASKHRINRMNEINVREILYKFNMTTNYNMMSESTELFESVYNVTLKNGLDFTCSSDVLVVKGNIVQVSEVVRLECINSAKSVHIFATNKLIIDVDFVKRGALVAFIAPLWEVIDKRKINLDGKEGEEHPPHSETDENGNGVDGKHGNPGQQGGFFFGIGETFVNDDQLEIHVSGGKGGNGQRGGNGMKFLLQ